MQVTKLHSFASGFAEVFKRERKKAGYTQKSFAEYFDVSIDTIRNWEQGRKVPEIKTIEALCAEFGCEVDYLLGRMENSTHDVQFICDQTGLSEDAVLALCRQKDDFVTTQVLDFLLTNRMILKKIALYYASAFWDIDRRIEFRTFSQMCHELNLFIDTGRIDSRLFIADAHEGISTGKEYFHGLYDKESDVGRKMTFNLIRSCMSQSDVGRIQNYMYAHKDSPEITPQLSLISEFLICTGDGEFMKQAGCDLERFCNPASKGREGTVDGAD